MFVNVRLCTRNMRDFLILRIQRYLAAYIKINNGLIMYLLDTCTPYLYLFYGGSVIVIFTIHVLDLLESAGTATSA